jgi:polygalacturonase
VPIRLHLMKILAIVLLGAGCISGAVFDVKSFGAKGDGQTPEREAINKAIDAAAAAGGGTVHFPPGT